MMTNENTESEKTLVEQIREAEMMRALDVVAESWQNDDLDLDTMAYQLEGMCEVAEGKISFGEFLHKTGLVPPKYH